MTMVTQLILILHMKNIFVFEIFNIYLNENKANICISSKCVIHIVYIYIYIYMYADRDDAYGTVHLNCQISVSLKYKRVVFVKLEIETIIVDKRIMSFK